MENIFIQKMNTGGGCMLDFYYNKKEKTALMLNDEGYNKLKFDLDKFKAEAKEIKEEINKYYGYELDIKKEENIAWLSLDAIQENINFKSIDYIGYEVFEMQDEDENTIWYEDMSEQEKIKLCENLLKN